MSQKRISDWIKSETEIKGICNEEELQFVPHRSSLGLSSGSRRFLMQRFVRELISPKTPEVGYYKACCPLPLKDCPSQWRLHNGTRLKPPLGYLTVPWNAVSGFSFGPRGELTFFLCPGMQFQKRVSGASYPDRMSLTNSGWCPSHWLT